MRVTEEEVKKIIDTELAEDEVTPFLRTASGLVTDLLGSSDVLTAERLADIECWLAAHFVAVRDPRVKSETIGKASFSYETAVVADGLRATRYGQQVLLLDLSGTMASLTSGKRPARFTALG
jgi:hypothetical protein